MLRPRAIPCLLMRKGRLVKTVRFDKPNYVGDPINAVRIFNDMEVDEIIVLDIGATPEQTGVPFESIGEMASECFMPMAFGGGITTVDEARRVFKAGVEKVVINSAAAANPSLITDVAWAFGSQAVVASVDVKKKMFGGYRVMTRGGRTAVDVPLVEWMQQLEKAGAGELMINAIDRDGVMQGYDLDLIKTATAAVKIPVIAAGGAGTVSHMGEAVKLGGASAAAVGSMAVYQGPNRAVLINFPTPSQLKAVFQ